MTAGSFIAVVGPSGAGKDTLIEAALARRSDLLMARRVITRPPAPGTEDFESVEESEFEARRLAGGFALHWHAHGLYYGIPASVDDDLAAGRHVLANLSRAVLVDAHKRFDSFFTIYVSAPADVLAERLTARGREAPKEIAQRLARNVADLPAGIDMRFVDNGGALEDGVAAFLAALPVQLASA
ncbi:MAG: phosphonate metabolism protein/1,5-bisphosphokinase (PRPP-forming) PhnN [Pseudomonadota bacterium]